MRLTDENKEDIEDLINDSYIDTWDSGPDGDISITRFNEGIFMEKLTKYLDTL